MSSSIKEYYTDGSHTFVRFVRTNRLYSYKGTALYNALKEAETNGESLGRTLNSLKKFFREYKLVEEEE